MATDSSQMRWQDLLAWVDSAQKANGNGYADTVNIPGLGLVNVSRSNGGIAGSQTGVSGIQLDDPSRGGKGGGWQLGQGADGSITRTPYEYKTSPIDLLPAILGTAVAGAGLGGYLPGGESVGASGASGTIGGGASGLGEVAATGAGGYSIPSAAELAAAGYDVGGMGLTGAGGIGTAESVAAAGAGAANYGAGGGMLDTILSKGADFLTSKAGSAVTGGLLSAISGANAPESTTATSRVELDPRMAEILYGANGNDGFLSQITSNMNAPQNAGMQAFGNGMDNYLSLYGRGEFDNNMRGAVALRDMRFDAPQAQSASMQAAQVNAPGQNNLNLQPAFQDMVYGAPGSNPYLTGGIQKGINQSQNAFTDMMTSATRNLTESILPSIRSGAVVNGAMGSSRQGIAEGRALNDFSTQMGQAMQRFGQGNTDSAIAAQAGAYDADRNRQLSAMSGLNQNQYGTAFQNAGFQQQASQANAAFQQQANLANQQAQLATNQQNVNNLQSGIGMSSGLLGQAVGYGQNQDAYNTQKLGQTAGLLSNFTGLGTTTTQTQPLYQNTAGNILGGALAGASLWNAFNPKQA